MNSNSRTPIIAGNWKMNLLNNQAVQLIEELKPLVSSATGQIVACVPFTDIVVAAKALEGSNIALGAQNCHWEQNGAFTGEISANMLKELGVTYVILGHSERRQYFGETDKTVNMRLKAALQSGLTAIVCVGETLTQREEEKTFQVINEQLQGAFEEIAVESLNSIVVAYEPVWAIGTGLTASPEQAQEIHAYIRSLVAEKYGNDVAQNCSILYGGSCNGANAAGLFANPDIDGGLIGGASLKAADFKAIIDAF